MKEDSRNTRKGNRLESEIKREILRYLNSQYMTMAVPIYTMGIPDMKRKGGFRRNPSRGVSDILGCKGTDRGYAKFFALEVKRPGNKPTDDQEFFLRAVAIHGGYAAVVHSVDDARQCWEEI